MKKTLKIITVIAIVAVLAVALLACVPSSIDAASKKMEKAGYSVSASTYTKRDSGCDGDIYATSGLSIFHAYHYSTAKEAKAAYEDAKELFGENNAYKQKGNWLYWGPEAAVKAFEK